MVNTKLKVHPVADLFPMLPDDELKDLAADIAERGLLQPIVLDAEGRILDGRNRHAACELASIEPEFTTYDGDDPDGYALAVNIARRHLTKGQQAMVAAQAIKVSRNGTRKTADVVGLSKTRLSAAMTVLDHAPDLVAAVIVGTEPLDNAYRQARDRKVAADDRDTQLAMLRSEAPDLADMVIEERLTLAGALAELRERGAQRESERRAAIANLGSVLIYLRPQSITPARLAADYDDALATYSQEDLDLAAETMTEIAQRKAMQHA